MVLWLIEVGLSADSMKSQGFFPPRKSVFTANIVKLTLSKSETDQSQRMDVPPFGKHCLPCSKASCEGALPLPELEAVRKH